MPETLVEVVRGWARDRPLDRALTFVVDGHVETDAWSYAEIDRRARSIAVELGSACRPGDRALLLYPPALEFVAAFFGCLYAGVIAVPAYPPTPRTLGRLEAIIRDSLPSVVLVPAAIAPLVRAGLAGRPDLPVLRIVETDALDDRADAWEDPGLGGSTLAFLQYTSGSTADPKGVMLTHANLLANERMIAAAFGHQGERLVGVHWLPLYHDMGLIGGVLQPLCLGVPAYLMSPIEFLKRPVTWLQAISHFRATTSGGPNFGYERLVRRVTPQERRGLDLSSWMVAYNGAEPLRPETMERFAVTFAECGFRAEAVYPCYGLAEATLFVSGVPPLSGPVIRSFRVEPLERGGRTVAGEGPGSRRLVSSGRPWLEERIVIAHPEEGRRLADGLVGEIWVSGPNVAAGYWNRPEDSRATFGAELTDGGGGPFLRTGDLGFVLDDELFVTGRIKDLIIVRGRNYYPQDIERTIEQAHPGIRPGCGAAFSVEVDQQERLVIVQEVGAGLSEDEPEEIVRAIRRAVAAQHELNVRDVVLIPPGEIPKTSSGKIQRRQARQLYLEDALPVVARSARSA